MYRCGSYFFLFIAADFLTLLPSRWVVCPLSPLNFKVLLAALMTEYGRSEDLRLVGFGHKDHGTSAWLSGSALSQDSPSQNPTIILSEAEETFSSETNLESQQPRH